MAISPTADIHTPADIQQLVQAFYAQVQADALLGPVFTSRIPEGHWPGHLDTMTRFWTAALLGQTAGYRGNPGAKHLYLPIEHAHFERWLVLFGRIVDERYVGHNATEIKLRAQKMGELFQAKIASARAGSGHAIL